MLNHTPVEDCLEVKDYLDERIKKASHKRIASEYSKKELKAA